MVDFSTSLRTHTCGELRAADEGNRVSVCGWVRSNRGLGGLAFLELRDRYGSVQVAVKGGLIEQAGRLSLQDVVRVTGTVKKRGEKDVNREMQTGEIEIVAQEITLISPTLPTPFAVEDTETPHDDVRYRHRVLDLRRPAENSVIAARSRASKVVRDFLHGEGFVEIETPVLGRSTPEGARDFLVPSRQKHGHFFALPQSPQLYKQCLMVSGFDRYFQLARCFRDEDFRADRQSEHTQIDLEMSFVSQEDIFSLVEGLIERFFGETAGAGLQTPFPRITYDDAMERWGADKPDSAAPEAKDYTDLFLGRGMRIVDAAVEAGGRLKAVTVPRLLSRKEAEAADARAKEAGLGGLLWLKRTEGSLSGPLAKFAPEGLGLPQGHTLLAGAGDPKQTTPLLCSEGLRHSSPPEGLRPLWVTEFPMFGWNDREGRIDALHHLFTAIKPQSEPAFEELERAAEKGLTKEGFLALPPVLTEQYDLVINGRELGSGSIRITDACLQERVLRVAGYDDERVASLQFLLDALRYGAPPHGGIALGFDRLVAMALGRDSIREVIAFPKTTTGQALMEDAPSAAPRKLLRELGLSPVVKTIPPD